MMKPVRVDSGLLSEIIVRIFLFVLFWVTDDGEPFHRKIHPDELWLYKNPRSDSYVPVRLLWFFVITCPCISTGIFYFIYRNKNDVLQSFLGVNLSIWLTGSITNFIKLGVGRPRPDFFWRCFPDGIYNEEMKCSGDRDIIRDGYKSFPSGHSALSFSSLMFVSMYLAGKLHCFSSRGRGQTWRLCLVISPLLLGSMIAISRTSDYHHHWQDVTVGSVLGLTIGYLSYRQFYPTVNKSNCHLPYEDITPILPLHLGDNALNQPNIASPI